MCIFLEIIANNLFPFPRHLVKSDLPCYSLSQLNSTQRKITNGNVKTVDSIVYYTAMVNFKVYCVKLTYDNTRSLLAAASRVFKVHSSLSEAV